MPEKNWRKEQYTNIYEEAVTKRYVLPGNFSLTNNMEETALYLSEIINRIFEKIPKTNSRFSKRSVENKNRIFWR